MTEQRAALSTSPLIVRSVTFTAALSSPSARARVYAGLRDVVRRAGAAGIRLGAGSQAVALRAVGPAAIRSAAFAVSCPVVAARLLRAARESGRRVTAAFAARRWA